MANLAGIGSWTDKDVKTYARGMDVGISDRDTVSSSSGTGWYEVPRPTTTDNQSLEKILDGVVNKDAKSAPWHGLSRVKATDANSTITTVKNQVPELPAKSKTVSAADKQGCISEN